MTQIQTPDAVPARRILLVDDEMALLIPLGRYFRNLGCVVDVAEEPEIAEALLDHRRYDVVIIDLRLTPFGNAEGLEVLRGLRRRDHWTSVIVLSAFVSPDVEEEAVRLGVDAVLRKPQPLAELAQLALDTVGGTQGSPVA
jgi:CheY-like chemotaxis protein